MYSLSEITDDLNRVLDEGGCVKAEPTEDPRVMRVGRYASRGVHLGTHLAEITQEQFDEIVSSCTREAWGRWCRLPSQLAQIAESKK